LKVSKEHWWVLALNLIAYPIILFITFRDTGNKSLWENKHKKIFESRYVWVLVDTFLTIANMIYFGVHYYSDNTA
jgi:hypothetical protein